MKKLQIVLLALFGAMMGFAGQALHAQPVLTQTLAVTGLQAEGNCFCNPAEGLLGKRKKKHKAKYLAAGIVIGEPVGFGARVIVKPTRLAAVGDVAYNRVRSDRGVLTDALVLKTDARYYADGFLGKVLRPYVFAGATMQRGKWDETQTQSVFSADIGVGAGVKLWRLELNGEAGLLLPVKQVDTYRPGFGAFANVGVMVWLF